jgi:serine protease Do
VTTVVDNGSPADLAGLQPGDLIEEVDRQKVSTADDIQQAMDRSDHPEGVLLRIRDQGVSVFVTLSTR